MYWACKTGSRVEFKSTHTFYLLKVNPDTTRLAKNVKLFDHNTTHLNNKLTRHYPFDPFIKQVVLDWHNSMQRLQPVWPII